MNSQYRSYELLTVSCLSFVSEKFKNFSSLVFGLTCFLNPFVPKNILIFALIPRDHHM